MELSEQFNTQELVKQFNTQYPNWSISVQRIMTEEPGIEIFKATITPDMDKPDRYFSAYSSEKSEIFNSIEIAQSKAIDIALKLLLSK